MTSMGAPRQPRVAPPPGVLRRVPERRPLPRPARVRPPGELGSQHDLLVQDVLATGVVVDLAGALVADALARPVRRCPRDAAPLAPREHLDVEEVLGRRAVLSLAQQLPAGMFAQRG